MPSQRFRSLPSRDWCSRSAAIAIPVRNEADRIAPCLRALARQSGGPAPPVVLLLNNCTDATEGIVRALTPSLPMDVHLRCVDLSPDRAHAGTARSLAIQRAAALAGPDGVILTTDADSVAPPSWLGDNLAAIAHGADAVTGRAVIDPVEARQIPAALHEADARECAYAALLDEIACLLDPDPADPWPRHTEASGASIAVTVAAWRMVGGMEAMPVGEDRAFVQRLRCHDRAIRHQPDVWVQVSGRTDGRAAGGMADTIRRRMAAPDLFLDDALESANAAVRRARLRRRARVAFASGDAPPDLASALGLPPRQLATLLDGRYFGAAWAMAEASSRTLVRRRVPVADLAQQAARARRVLGRLRAQAEPISVNRAAAARPDDSAAEAAD